MVGAKTVTQHAVSVAFLFALLVFPLSSVLAETPSVSSPCAEVAKAAEQASSLRGLPLRKPVGCSEVGKQEFQNLVHEELLKDNPPARMHYEGIAARMLGTIPSDYDYDRCVASDYGSDVLAFYHPDRRAIVFPNWVTTPRDVLIHETVHALQDQYFNLSKLRDAANTTNDRALALSALAEGDAVLIQDQYNKNIGSHALEGLDAQAISPPLAGCGLPELLRRQFEFPYDYGIYFVEHLRAHGGTTAINAAFKSPPRTTREILYPREFLAAVTAPSAKLKLSSPPAGLTTRVVYEEVMGEYFIRSFFRQLVSPEEGIRAAKGWHGDKVRLFEVSTDHRKILFWDSLWESPKDADQFRITLLKSLQKIFSVTLDFNAKHMLFSTQQYPVISLRQDGKSVSYSISEVRLDELIPRFNHLK